MYLFLAVCLLSPPALAAALYARWSPKLIAGGRLALLYGLMVGVVNFFPLAIIGYGLGHADYFATGALFSLGFTVKYLACAFLFAVLVPLAARVVGRNIRVRRLPEE